MKKTNILFISNHVSKTGAPAVLQLLLNYIKQTQSEKYTVYVSSLLMADIKKNDREYWEKTYNCFFVQFIYDINLIDCAEISIITSSFDLDVVYGNGISTFPQLYMFKKHNNCIKTILHVHENSNGFQIIKKMFGQELKDAYKSIDHFITVSKWQIEELQNYGVSLSNITHLPEPIDVDKLNVTIKGKTKNKLNQSSKTKIFGCGSGESRKGIDRFIEVSKKFDQNLYEFIWIGDVEIVDNHVILNGHGVFDDYKVNVGSVKFIGQVDVPAELLNSGDIFLMLSRQDPCPLVVLEALYLELFVVTIKESGDSYIYCNDHDEILDTYNCDAVVNSIHSIQKKKQNTQIVNIKREYCKILNNIINPRIISSRITNIIDSLIVCKYVTLYNFNNFEGEKNCLIWTKDISTIKFNKSYKLLELQICNVLTEINKVEFIFDDDYQNSKTLLIEQSTHKYDLKFDISNKKKIEIRSKLKKLDCDKRYLGTHIVSMKVDGTQINSENSNINDANDYNNYNVYHDQQINPRSFDKSDKIVFCCISGTSGYGVLARETVIYLRQQGYLVNYKSFEFEKSINDHSDILKIDDFNESEATCYILNFPPHVLSHVYHNLIGEKCHNKKIISFPLWESEYINSTYVDKINRFSSSVIVSSQWNKNTFKKCGVIKDIQVLYHTPICPPLIQKEKASKFIYEKSILFGSAKNLNSSINYYTIGQWTKRKGITEVIESFCEAFTKNDNVTLVLKTYYKSHQSNDIKICIDRINSILNRYKIPPTIYYINHNLTDSEIMNIHSCGDIYVSATKSEGIGLGPLTASHYNKPVIITGYGAQCEYLKNANFVSYSLHPAEDDLSFSMDLRNQLWAHPNESDLVDKMREVYITNYENDISYYSW